MNARLDGPILDVEKLYLDYVNNFLTIAGFAEWYSVSEQLANLIIKEGRAKNHGQH